jgi:hypothetical protein
MLVVFINNPCQQNADVLVIYSCLQNVGSVYEQFMSAKKLIHADDLYPICKMLICDLFLPAKLEQKPAYTCLKSDSIPTCADSSKRGGLIWVSWAILSRTAEQVSGCA